VALKCYTKTLPENDTQGFYPKERSRPQLKNNVHAKIKNQITLVRTGDWKFSG
jgi:hypothetical protein